MWQKEDKLIRDLLLNSFGAFFLSMLTSSLGTLVDGLVIGNVMDTQCVAAFGLVNPLNFIFAITGSILGSGMSNGCARALGRNDREQACRLFSVTRIVGIGLSIAVMILIVAFIDPITTLLGAESGTEMFVNAKEYLLFYVLGLPAITATKLLSSIMPLDSDRRRIVTATAVMTAVNIAGDLFCVSVLHAGLAEIALVTTISYYAGTLVLMHHFIKKDIIFRFSVRGLDWRGLFDITRKGLPKGVSRVTSSIRGIFINRTAAAIAAVAVAGFSVQSNINYMTNAVVMGLAQSFMLVTSLYYGEENKEALKRVTRTACRLELMFVGLLSLALLALAPFVAKLYLGSNADALPAGTLSVRWYAAGLLFQGFCILFADYLQVTGRVFWANMVYVAEDVVLTAAAVSILAERFSTGGLYAGISLAHVLTVCLIPVFIMAVNRRKISSSDDLLMLEEGFGIAPENEYAQTVTDLEGAVAASEEIIVFCEGRGVDHKTASRLGLAAEEMVTNIIQHGFKDGKPHSIDLRALYKEADGVTLIIRDNCRPFDPKERFRYLTDDDPTANIGLRLTMNLAKEVTYTSAMRLNNVTIKV
ncbi:MAG: ATP-binding protein [Firmicutes bacterium]|nr:ATP-binding protein [Bacillota bacterium]